MHAPQTNKALTIEKLLLPTLILITPFLVFLDYNSYCLRCAETWIALTGLMLFGIICSVAVFLGGWIVSGLIVAALNTVFIDLQFTPANLTDWVNQWAAILLFTAMQTVVLSVVLKEKFYTIATVIFSTFFLVTIFQLAFNSQAGDTIIHHRESAADSPPRIIHLILDEHIGIEGIPTDVEGGLATKELITQFYLKNGFQLFGGAFSRYFRTNLSVPNMLNFDAESNSTGLTSSRTPYKLLRNKYFSLLADKKYHVEVVSAGWIDFCADSPVVIVRCVQKHWASLKNFAKLKWLWTQKLQGLSARYLSRSVILRLIYRVLFPLQVRLLGLSPSLYQWTWALDPERTRTESLETVAELKSIWADILALPRGTVLVAHLMLPHDPYVALPNCSIRLPSEDFLWSNRGKFGQLLVNTPASRKEKYELYFAQLECLYRQLAELFRQMQAANIYDDSIILFHGDHGSRITINDPVPENRHALTNRDLIDGFSTLFAVKIPGKAATSDKAPLPLDELFANFVFEAGLTSSNRLRARSDPYVYLMSNDGEELVRTPYIPPE